MFINVYWKQIWTINWFVSKETKNTHLKAKCSPTQQKFQEKKDVKIIVIYYNWFSTQ